MIGLLILLVIVICLVVGIVFLAPDHAPIAQPMPQRGHQGVRGPNPGLALSTYSSDVRRLRSAALLPASLLGAQ